MIKIYKKALKVNFSSSPFSSTYFFTVAIYAIVLIFPLLIGNFTEGI